MHLSQDQITLDLLLSQAHITLDPLLSREQLLSNAFNKTYSSIHLKSAKQWIDRVSIRQGAQAFHFNLKTSNYIFKGASRSD